VENGKLLCEGPILDLARSPILTDQTLPLTGVVFTGAMLVAGVALAFLVKANPGLFQAIPALMWLLGFALVIDLAANALAGQGRIEPLTMQWRVAGFLGGGVLHVLVSTLLG
jgi:hypothetical protein